MESHSPFAHADVPLVGQPVECFEPLVIQPARCKCDPANVPFMITGVQIMATCGRCKKAYLINTVQFDRARSNSITVEVACVLPTQGTSN